MISFSQLYWHFKGSKVYALVGESGTGKSFRAKVLAQKYGIELIIDDGLLIKGDKILAGRSAKTENTFLAAVRVALFDDKEHRDTIAKTLNSQKYKKVLIIGTSEKMVNKIAVRLQIPQAQKIIRIEDISTREEMEKAIRSRRIEGKHVIPVPSIEVQKNFPQIFNTKVRVLLKRKQRPITGASVSKLYEKSVVKPSFSKTERIVISEAALSQMVVRCVKDFDELIKIKKLTVKTLNQGYSLIIVTDIPFSTDLTDIISKLQAYIIDTIERFTGILIEDVHIIIDKISK